MISKLIPGYLSPDKLITLRVLVVIAVYALLTFAGRRGWLKAKELPWVAGAVIFWAIGWLFSAVLVVVRSQYPELNKSVPISIGLVAPVIIAMIIGLRFIIKRASGEAPAEPPAETRR